MNPWIIGAAFYAYVTCRAIWGNRRLSLWLVVPLSMIWPLLLPFSIRWRALLRPGWWRGLGQRQRDALGLSALGEPGPDDGGFLP